MTTVKQSSIGYELKLANKPADYKFKKHSPISMIKNFEWAKRYPINELQKKNVCKAHNSYSCQLRTLPMPQLDFTQNKKKKLKLNEDGKQEDESKPTTPIPDDKSESGVVRKKKRKYASQTKTIEKPLQLPCHYEGRIEEEPDLTAANFSSPLFRRKSIITNRRI